MNIQSLDWTLDPGGVTIGSRGRESGGAILSIGESTSVSTPSGVLGDRHARRVSIVAPDPKFRQPCYSGDNPLGHG